MRYLFIAIAISFSVMLGNLAAAQEAALIPSFRLERITRLAQSYSPAPKATIICNEITSAPVIDGDLSDWPAPKAGEILSAGLDDNLNLQLRSCWDEVNLYLGADIRDDVILPVAELDLFSGDLLNITLRQTSGFDEETKELPDSHTFTIASAPTDPILLKDGKPLINEANALPYLAIADTESRRVVELRLPWIEITPLTYEDGTDLHCLLRLEDRDRADQPEPVFFDTNDTDYRLKLLPRAAVTSHGSLNLTSAAIESGEILQGVLHINTVQPEQAAKLRLDIAALNAESKESTIARMSQSLALDKGANIFRFSWDSAANSAGDYVVLAKAAKADAEMFTQRVAFNIQPKKSAAKSLYAYNQEISNPVVIARLQKAREQNPAAPMKFAVMGDPRNGEFIFRQALQQAAKEGAEFAIVIGDLVPSGLKSQYLQLAKLLEEAPLPVLVTAGNHDIINRGDIIYRQLFGALDYVFDLAGYHFIIIDNSIGKLTAAQLTWLEKELQNPLPKFVFTHKPPATIQKWAWHSFSSGAERFTALMEQYKPQRVFVSHIHAYDRATQNGVEYILTGGAGAPLYSQLGEAAAVHHFVLVNATADGVTDAPVILKWQK